MATAESGQDARRSRRFNTRIECDLTQGPTTTRVVSVDVSHHGVFLSTKTPPRERFLVRVTLHLTDGPLYANAFVSRRVAPAPGVQSGVGVQFFAMPERAKRRWDNFIQSLATSEVPEDASEEGVASFLVKLDTTEKLREFFDRALRTNSLYMVTSALRPIGSKVAVVMVHPVTGAEFVLYGEIARVRVEVPRGLEVRVDPLHVSEHSSFARFLLGEDPLALTPLPDLETQEMLDAPPSAPQLRSPPPLPQILRDSAPPPPPAGAPPPPPPENLRAINVDLGGPPLEYGDEIRIEDSFEWASVGDDVVIDVDLSEIEGEDLAELHAERGLRVSTSHLSTRYEPNPIAPTNGAQLALGSGPLALPAPVETPPETPAEAPVALEVATDESKTDAPKVAALSAEASEAELPSELVDLGSILLAPNDPRLEAAATEMTSARSPSVEPAIPQVRRVSNPEDGSEDEDVERGSEDLDPITGDIERGSTPTLKPRRMRSSDAPTPIKSKIPDAETERAPLPLSSLPSSLRTAILACPACTDSTPLVTGPAPGALAPFARNRLFHCRSCRRVVSVMRVASAKSRAQSRKALEHETVEPLVPVSLVYEIAELARAPRCSTCGGNVTTPKSLATVVAAMSKLPMETPLPRHRCPHCDHLGMIIKPA